MSNKKAKIPQQILIFYSGDWKTAHNKMTPPEIFCVRPFDQKNESWVRVVRSKMAGIFAIKIGPNFRPKF